MTYRTFDGTSQVESVTLGRYSSSKSGVSDGGTTQGAVYFSDDVDTGFYSPADNKIALITGGTERLHIDDSGNVGIGGAPGTKFEITGATPYLTLKNDTHEDTEGGRESKIIFEGEQSGGEITTLAQIQASHDGASDDQKGDLIFSINDGNDGAAPSEVIRVTSDKRVGFGEASPGTQIEINGATPYITIKNDTHEDIEGGRESKVIFEGEQSGGEITTLAEIQVSHDGTADDEKGDLIFKVNGGSQGASPSERMRIESSGNVGIGTQVPDTEFHVKGGGTVAKFEGTGGSGFISLYDSDDSTQVFVGGDGGTFKVQTSGGSWADKLSITAAGDATFAEDVITSDLILNTYGEFKSFDFGAIAASSNETTTIATPRSNKQLFVEITTVGHENTNNGTFVMRSQGVCNWAGTSKQRVGHGDTNYDESLGEGDYRSFGGGSHALDFDGNNLRLTVANSGSDTMAEVITFIRYIWSD